MRQREKEMHNIRVKLIVFLQVQNGKLEKLSQNQCKNKPYNVPKKSYTCQISRSTFFIFLLF